MSRKTTKKAQTLKEGTQSHSFPTNFPSTLDNLNFKEFQAARVNKRSSHEDLYKDHPSILPNMKPIEKVTFEFTDDSPANARELVPTNSAQLKTSGAGSLENFGESHRKESSKDRIVAPTFGEEEFNNKLNNQVENSPTRGVSKTVQIDKLLAEHKKKKAIQRAVDLKNNVQEQNNPYSFDVNTSPKFGADSDEYLRIEQQIIGQSSQSPKNLKRAVNSLDKNLNVNGSIPHQHGSVPTSSQGERLEKSHGFLSAMECTESQYFSDAGLDVHRALSGKMTSKANSPNSKLRSPKTPKSIKSPKTPKSPSIQSPKKAEPEQVLYHAPKISENSKKIFKSSARAREDQEILQQLYARAQSSENGDYTGSSQLQNIPEDRLEYIDSSRKLPREEPNSPLNQSNFLRNNNNLSVNSKRTANSPASSAANTPTSFKDTSPISSKVSPFANDKKSKFSKTNNSNTNTPLNKSSTKRQDTTKLDQSTITASDRTPTRKLKFTGNCDSPRSSKAGGNSTGKKSPKKNPPTFEALDRQALRASMTTSYRTIVEHRSPKTRSPEARRAYRSASPPSTKDLMDIATTTRNIYVKVVNNPPKENVYEIPEPHPIVKKSHLLQSLSMPRQPQFEEMTPEELAQYDEVQRIETMLRNLHKIQKSNMINLESNVNRFEAGHFLGKNWSEYAEDINESAHGRRNVRKQAELDKLARLAGMVPPFPMKKTNITLDSFIGSAQMRESVRTNRGLDLPAFENGQGIDLSQYGIYERHMLWRGIVDKKTERLGEFLDNRDYEGCTFSPNFFTKNFNVWKAVPWKLNTPTNLLSHHEKTSVSTLPDERMVSEVGSMLKEKSLHQERKAVETYTDHANLKKVYNLYKNEIFVPKMSSVINSRGNFDDESNQRNFQEGYSARFNSVDVRMD